MKAFLRSSLLALTLSAPSLLEAKIIDEDTGLVWSKKGEVVTIGVQRFSLAFIRTLSKAKLDELKRVQGRNHAQTVRLEALKKDAIPPDVELSRHVLGAVYQQALADHQANATAWRETISKQQTLLETAQSQIAKIQSQLEQFDRTLQELKFKTPPPSDEILTVEKNIRVYDAKLNALKLQRDGLRTAIADQFIQRDKSVSESEAKVKAAIASTVDPLITSIEAATKRFEDEAKRLYEPLSQSTAASLSEKLENPTLEYFSNSLVAADLDGMQAIKAMLRTPLFKALETQKWKKFAYESNGWFGGTANVTVEDNGRIGMSVHHVGLSTYDARSLEFKSSSSTASDLFYTVKSVLTNGEDIEFQLEIDHSRSGNTAPAKLYTELRDIKEKWYWKYRERLHHWGSFSRAEERSEADANKELGAQLREVEGRYKATNGVFAREDLIFSKKGSTYFLTFSKIPVEVGPDNEANKERFQAAKDKGELKVAQMEIAQIQKDVERAFDLNVGIMLLVDTSGYARQQLLDKASQYYESAKKIHEKHPRDRQIADSYRAIEAKLRDFLRNAPGFRR